MRVFNQFSNKTREYMIYDSMKMICREYITGEKKPTFREDIQEIYEEALNEARNMKLEEAVIFLIDCIEPVIRQPIVDMLNQMVFTKNGKPFKYGETTEKALLYLGGIL